ncbi:MAG: hypothetical protein R3E56_06715 [Burkholderiaceae bacterium]
MDASAFRPHARRHHAAVRVAPASADFILGCDLVVTASAKTLDMARTGRTRVLANSREVMPGEFTPFRPDLGVPWPAAAAQHRPRRWR